MSILNYYRLYFSIGVGGFTYFYLFRRIWVWIIITILVRVLWYFADQVIDKRRVNSWIATHSYDFKQQLGPYGIRLLNQAENDISIRRNLAEVFTPDLKKLKDAVDQLEMMDTLFKAGMRPDGDTYQIHDCKLKYGKYRLEKCVSK